MDLKMVLRALRAAWWLPVVGLLVGAVLGLAVSLARTPHYTAHTQFFVSTESATTSDIFQGSQFSQQRVTSYAQLLAGEELASRVATRLGLSVAPHDVAEEIRATAVPNTVLIDVDVTDRSPDRAQRIASAVGTEFAALAAELESTGPGSPSPVKVTVTDQPEVPDEPSSPRTVRDVGLAAVVGLLLGAGIATLRAHLDRTVREPEELATVSGAPVVGVILRDEELHDRHAIGLNSHTRSAENFRQVRANLQFLDVDDPPKVIVISSSVPAEGKTTTAINLAITMAEGGRRVTLIEGDLRRPRVTRYLGMVSGAGLTNVLAGTADLDDVLQPHGDGNLKVVAAGPTPPNPSELLASSHMRQLLEELRSRGEFVIIDAPPLLPVADTSGISVIADGVVLCVRYGQTRREQVRQARTTLDRIGARTLGVILNIVPANAEITSAYGYGYGYGYDADRAVPVDRVIGRAASGQ